MKAICLFVLFGTLLCGSVASSDSSEESVTDPNVDVLTDQHETTVYCNSYCNCLGLNGSPTTYCCPDGKPDPSQCPGSIISYGGSPGRYALIPSDREVVQFMTSVRSPGNTISYGEYLDWLRKTYRDNYATNNCNSRLSAVLGGCRVPPSYTAPCISRNCKPALQIYNQCTTRNCNPVPPPHTGCTVNNCPPLLPPYTGCTTRNCNTASRCCRPQLGTNHLRDAILSVVSQSYSMTKGEFIGNIEAVIARQREFDWDPVMTRGSTGVNWPNNWAVFQHAGVTPRVDATDDAANDVTLEDSTETEYQSV